MKRFATAFALLLLSLTVPTHAQQSIPQRDIAFGFGSSSQPPAPSDALDIKNPAGTNVGKVWFEQSRNGLIVYGTGTGLPAIKWARFPGELPTSGHLNLWLSFEDKVAMPEIGWGNQFGFTNCAEYGKRESPPSIGAEDCATWSARQEVYRAQFRRMFLREWQLSPGVSREKLASDAFRQTLAFARDFDNQRLKKLDPNPIPTDPLSGPNLTGGFSGSAWSFQAFLPWEALPPSATLILSKLSAVVEVEEGSKLVASTALGHKPDDPTTFNRLTFARPRTFGIARCGYPLGAPDALGNLSGWFFPAQSSEISETFIVTNDAGGYRYDPEGLSPVPQWTRYFSRELDTNNTVCGPRLRFASSGKSWAPDQQPENLDPDNLQQLRLPDGSYLLRTGPTLGSYSPLGSGRCGACPTYRVGVYHLDPQKGVTLAFSGMIRIDEPEVADGDILFSADWKTITTYEETLTYSNRTETRAWKSKRYCLQPDNNSYTMCGDNPSSPPPPAPRQIKMR